MVNNQNFMPSKNVTILIVSVVIVVIGGFLISERRGDNPDNINSFSTVLPSSSVTPAEQPTPKTNPKPQVIKSPSPSISPTASSSVDLEPETSLTPKPTPTNSALISYTDSGYAPAYRRIEVGMTVIFRNDSTSSMWPASDHPLYSRYTTPGVDNCEVSPEAIFDACKPIQPGEWWAIKFESSGTFPYYDYLLPSNGGTIVVQ